MLLAILSIVTHHSDAVDCVVVLAHDVEPVVLSPLLARFPLLLVPHSLLEQFLLLLILLPHLFNVVLIILFLYFLDGFGTLPVLLKLLHDAILFVLEEADSILQFRFICIEA